MYSGAIVTINNYIFDYLPIPPKTWPRAVIDERRYARWAATDVLDKLIKYESMSDVEAMYNELPDVYDLIISFIDSLDESVEQSRTERYANICKIARDSLYDILCLFERNDYEW